MILIVKKILSSEHFRKQASVFANMNATQTDIMLAEEKSIVCLYGGKESDTLDYLRYIHFVQKTSNSTKPVQACPLPPTSVAAKFHSLRVFFQVMKWINFAKI